MGKRIKLKNDVLLDQSSIGGGRGLLGFINDYYTQNNTDSWIPVTTGDGKIQHRVLPPDSGWIHLTMEQGFEDGWGQGLYLRQQNGLITIQGYIKTTEQTSWVKVITRLPEGYRPTMELNVVCRTTWNQVMKISIQPSGEITTLNMNDGSDLPANEYIYLLATYMN